MTLPTIKRLPPDETQREHLRRWIQEWNLLNALESDRFDVESDIHPVPQTPSADNSTPVQPGDIRLLPPDIEPDAPRYVTVWNPEENSAWQVIPFGLLSEPATPEEIRTGRSAPALRVLCIWNRFAMPEPILLRSQLADRMTEDERQTIEHAPADRVGPPLRHPLDPRWDYREKEILFRERILNACYPALTYEIMPPEALPKAAEDNGEYGKKPRMDTNKHE